MNYLLGIDLGTTGLKACIFDINGNLAAREYERNKYIPNRHGWAEQDPESWWVSCCNTIKRIISESEINPEDIEGVGVSGFHHCPVFLDEKGNTTRPTIVTHDRRLNESLKELKQNGLLDELIKRTQSMITVGHFPTIYNYVRRNDYGSLRKTRWIILAKDYIRFKLTDRIGTEICDATGTHLIEMPDEKWSNHICRLLEMPMEKLPGIGNPNEVFGEVTREAANSTGLKTGTPVVYGGGDSHCALLGMGVISSGQVGLLLGTNGTLRACFEGFVRHPDYRVWVQRHVIPGMYTVSASTMAGSSVLEWFRSVFCEDGETYAELEKMAGDISHGSEGLIFHPYIYGERSPFYNPGARGSFLGIKDYHSKGHFVRSVLEGISFCIANCFELVKETALAREENIKDVRLSGGGSVISLWRQIMADVLQIPINITDVEEPGCFGAAILAGIGVGIYKDSETAIRKVVKVKDVIYPESEVSRIYQEIMKKFNKLYDLLEPILYCKEEDAT